MDGRMDVCQENMYLEYYRWKSNWQTGMFQMFTMVDNSLDNRKKREKKIEKNMNNGLC